MAQKKKELVIGGIAAALLFSFGSALAYYLVEEDRKVRRKKAARRAERTTMHLLSQIQEQQKMIDSRLNSMNVEQECDDETFNAKEHSLSRSNQLLLSLLEQLEAIRPLTAIVGKDSEPTDFERDLAGQLKEKKGALIDSAKDLLHRLDVCHQKLRKEAVKRAERRAAEEAQLREVESIEVESTDDEEVLSRSIEEIEIESQVELERQDMIQAETTSIELNED